jgi:hypothetical protein
MSSFVVEYLTKSRSYQTITVSYFCDGRGESEGSASQVLWMLTCRIAAQRCQWLSNSRFLRRVASIDARTVTLPKAQCAFSAMLKSFGSDERFFLIIDGLDECSSLQNFLLVETVKSACGQKQPPQVRCFISSRPTYSIGRCLHGVPKIDLSKEVRVEIDITAYTTSRVGELSLKAPQYAFCREHLIEGLIGRSSGMFLFATLQIDLLPLDTLSEKAIEVIIQRLPSGLEETYERILRAIHPRDQAIARRILSWAICAFRPLRMDELVAALSVDDNHTLTTPADCRMLLDPEKDIRRICGGLVSIAANGSVLLAHQSVKDYLLSSSTKPMWVKNLDTWAKESLARTCIHYLMFDGVGEHPDSTLHQSGQTLLHHGDGALLEYASKYWSMHYRLAEYRSSYLPCLLQHFLEWRNRGVEYLPHYFIWTGISVSVDPMENPLHICSRLGFVGLASMYLEMGVDVDANPQFCGMTPLHHAAAHGYLGIARLLLARGADVNALTNTYGETPLHLAVINNHFDMVVLLLENGSDINAVAHISRSLPWELASDHGHVIVMQFLLEWGRIGGTVLCNSQVPFSGESLRRHKRMMTIDGYEGGASNVGALGGLRLLVTVLTELGADLAPSGIYPKSRPTTSKVVLPVRNGRTAQRYGDYTPEP